MYHTVRYTVLNTDRSTNSLCVLLPAKIGELGFCSIRKLIEYGTLDTRYLDTCSLSLENRCVRAATDLSVFSGDVSTYIGSNMMHT